MSLLEVPYLKVFKGFTSFKNHKNVNMKKIVFVHLITLYLNRIQENVIHVQKTHYSWQII